MNEALVYGDTYLIRLEALVYGDTYSPHGDRLEYNALPCKRIKYMENTSIDFYTPHLFGNVLSYTSKLSGG